MLNTNQSIFITDLLGRSVMRYLYRLLRMLLYHLRTGLMKHI